jgi:hypothetical protein
MERLDWTCILGLKNQIPSINGEIKPSAKPSDYKLKDSKQEII